MIIQFFYRKDTLQIDAVYRGCLSNSTKYVAGDTYEEVIWINPPFDVTRNHKVLLNAEGEVIDTEAHENLTQPTPTPEEVPETMKLQSPNGTKWHISITDTGQVLVKKED